jgi:hypothetical protein
MNEPAATKLKMLHGSTRCLIFGLLGLLPAIGLPFALAALWEAGRARQHEKRFWNAARPYRLLGVWCAALGTVAWILVAALIAFSIVTNTSR